MVMKSNLNLKKLLKFHKQNNKIAGYCSKTTIKIWRNGNRRK